MLQRNRREGSSMQQAPFLFILRHCHSHTNFSKPPLISQQPLIQGPRPSTSKKITTHLRFRWWLEFLAIKYSSIKAYTLVWDIILLQIMDYKASVNITSYVLGNQNNCATHFIYCDVLIFTLLWWSGIRSKISLKCAIVTSQPCASYLIIFTKA